MLPWARNALQGGIGSGSKHRSSNDTGDARMQYNRVGEGFELPHTPGWRSFDATKRRSAGYHSSLQVLVVAIAAALLGVAFGRTTASGAGASFYINSDLDAISDKEALSILNSTAALPEGLARNLRLTYAECDVGFPLLWPELEKTREHFYRQGVSLEEIETASDKEDATRVAIVNGQLYVKRFKGEWTKRSQAILASLHQALVTAPEPVPDVEFWFRGTDNVPPGPHFGLNREDGKDSEQMWLLPDFGFWSWPEPRVLGWQDARRKAKALDARLSWAEKLPRLFWRGAYLAKIREELRDAVSGHDWSDIGEINWGAGAQGRIAMEDHCRHRFLASVEGNSAYSGRLKYLALCRSVTVSHKMQWTQHFHGALDSNSNSPNQNIVVLKDKGWSDLAQVMDDLTTDQAKAQRIADNSVRTLRDRYLTPASVSCYWRRALSEYATTMRFKASIGDGVDYESFMLVDEVHWEPH
ncbi:hypothetical protein ACM66B_000834 [Microbotryomycetes sp. NB124-2]